MMIHQKLHGFIKRSMEDSHNYALTGLHHQPYESFQFWNKFQTKPTQTWNVGLLMMSPLCPPNAVCFLHTEGIERRVHLLQETNMANTHASIPSRIQRESGHLWSMQFQTHLQISRKKTLGSGPFPTPKSKWTYCIYILRLLPPLNGVHLVLSFRLCNDFLQSCKFLFSTLREFFLVSILKRTQWNSSKKHNMW